MLALQQIPAVWSSVTLLSKYLEGNCGKVMLTISIHFAYDIILYDSLWNIEVNLLSDVIRKGTIWRVQLQRHRQVSASSKYPFLEILKPRIESVVYVFQGMLCLGFQSIFVQLATQNLVVLKVSLSHNFFLHYKLWNVNTCPERTN